MTRRKRNLKAYEAVKRRSNGVCERCKSARATNIHHRRLRSQFGADSELNLTALCAGCHNHVHHHIEESYRDGWLISAKHHGKEVFDLYGVED